ncbi:hypothetical protein NQ314_011150 [Rhamnusium bicolor]|uniref:C2H2-type domain-containing protein n=1 Tax=Rhamnusium bicolor TaxID=1586634 RepID=A0AAV8XKM6_9CUCU|nr:hypothetical protein NQ314_011150 [Rhamnusium bicolor]
MWGSLQICYDNFINIQAFRKHMENHGRKSRIRCGFCNETFKNDEDLDVHHRNIHKKLKFSCDYCGKVYLSMYSIEKHVKKVHCQIQCVKCKEVNLCSFERHFLTHTGARDYKCNVCGKRFSRQRSFKNHVALHSDERSFQCAQCPKAYKTQPSLYIHKQRIHNFSCASGKTFQCYICSQEFTKFDNRLLAYLISLHPDIDLYFLRSKLSLINHIRKHSTSKPFDCQICSKQFKCKLGYTEHMNLHEHKKTKQEQVPDFCNGNFSTQDLLIDHLAHMNPKEENI